MVVLGEGAVSYGRVTLVPGGGRRAGRYLAQRIGTSSVDIPTKGQLKCFYGE